MKHNLLRITALLLSLLLFLSGCRSQVVEKVGVLPDRSTQLVAHNTENTEAEVTGKSWDVQNVDEIRLYASEMIISEQPSSHYFNNTPYLHRTVSQTNGGTTYSLENITAEGTLTQLHAISVPKGSHFYYSPDGTTAAYETWINNCLTLMLVDLATNEERVLWQSDEASLLKELQVSARLVLQWAPDGSSLLFIPICYALDSGNSEISDSVSSLTTPETSSTKNNTNSNDSTVTDDSHATEESSVIEESSVPEESSSTEESSAAAESSVPEESSMTEESSVLEESSVPEESSVLEESSVPEESSVLEGSSVPEESSVLEESFVPEDSSAPEESSVLEESSTAEESTVAKDSPNVDNSSPTEASGSTNKVNPLHTLSPQEKMQLIYQSLPNFPLLYAYNLDQKQMQSFLIASEDYPLYDSTTQPLICSSQDGNRFFIYFNSPWDSTLAHYLDLATPLHYSTPLTDYVTTFTKIGCSPLFYDDLVYIHVDGIGITALDPAHGVVMAQYSFKDPVHSFTIYENTLIVAQPSSIGEGIDVTAYLLNLDTKQSVLLYHNSETYSPFINHMEISQDGMSLLIEQLPSTYRTQKQLIRLSFK